MEQLLATKHGEEPTPVDTTGLCLLSLDGGGVRGLSTLYILKGLMTQLNQERQAANLPPVKPCETFDLIGGTSTGGLIAIMLGRLEMGVDECIVAYSDLMKMVFEKKSSWLPISWTGRIKSQFDSERLKAAVEEVITPRNRSGTNLFNDERERVCKVFVCTTAKEVAGITRLRSYSLPDELDIAATICEAALATSAATGFFDPVSIEACQFVDGALGANNPVDEVEGEAANIWCSGTGDLKPLVKCFVSVGTGKPGKKAIEDNMLRFLSKTLVTMVTETEETEKKFIARWAKHFDENRYFRFNVDQGLQGIGLAEYKEQGTIEAATREYLRHQNQKFRVRDCIQNLRQKQNRTDTTFAAVVRSLCNVPFLRNTHFVGRHSQLEELERTLFAKDRPSKIAVTGLGGVGKTQIVLELAYRTRERYPECSIFWMPAANAESLEQAYLGVGQQLRIPGLDKEQADVKKLLQYHLSQESVGQWLLIFDNADDIDMWINHAKSRNGSPGLVDYLPISSRGGIIFTTRSRKIAVKLAPQHVIKVPEMDEEVATQLLNKSLIDQTLLQNRQNILKLLEELTFLPLALVQAAAYINANGTTLSNYLSLLKSQEQDALELLSKEFEDDWRDRNAKNPVATTWLISFDHIRQLDPLAAEYLSFMSCIDPRDIPQSVLPPAQSRKKETDAIGTLSAYSFVSRREADLSLDLHRLVHLATRNWLRREESLVKWTAKALARLNEVFPDNDHKKRSIWRAYLPHARYVLESGVIENGVEERTRLLRKSSLCLYSDGRYNEAEESFSQTLETDKRVLGVEHPDTLISMGNLALTYSKQGRWKEAEELEMQVMETRKKVLGVEHPDTLTSMNNLASSYSNQGRWKEAEELEMQVVEMRKKVQGVEHPDTLTSMNNLALTYSNQGRWKEAEELEMQVMETRKKVLGVEHPDTLTSMNNLALTYSKQGRWKEAEELRVQEMQMCKRVLGVEHPETLTSMNNLASSYSKQGRWKEAEELGMQVVETRKKVLGVEHPDTLISMNNLASSYSDQGRWKEAEELEMQVVKTRKKVLGAEHPDTLTSMNNLASSYSDQGRWKE
ncbi:MAG: hypothetical protein M1816_005406, partial [Peltula sp. TS41687]